MSSFSFASSVGYACGTASVSGALAGWLLAFHAPLCDARLRALLFGVALVGLGYVTFVVWLLSHLDAEREREAARWRDVVAESLREASLQDDE